MYKYLFITYGEPGWKGVQMRAFRIAKYLPRDEVLFWNLYDSAFVKEWGFNVETKPASLVNPEDIVFPNGVEVIVFADLPSNELFDYCVYQAALQQNKRIVITDQVYHHGQMQEYIFRKFAENSDLFIVNSLSEFASEETDRVKVVPPQIELALTSDVRKEICEKFGIPEDAIIIFGAGYHANVFEKIKQLTAQLETAGHNSYTIVSGPGTNNRIEKQGRLIVLPFTTGDEYFKLLYSADIVMVKFGFLQILESLALHKPTIILGEAGNVLQNPHAVGTVLKGVLYITDMVTPQAEAYIENLVSDKKARQQLIKKIEKIHSGELFGARKTAHLVEEISNQPVKTKLGFTQKRQLAILVNNEIFEKADWIKQHKGVYPLCFINAMPTDREVIKRLPNGLIDRPIKDLQFDQAMEIIPHSYKQVFVFSRRKFDGFVEIFPWFEQWLLQVEALLTAADEIYLTEQGKKLFATLLEQHGQKVRSFT